MSTISGIARPGSARDLTDDYLGNEHLGTLAGAAEFQHVHAGIIGFDDGRQRTPFTQWRDVASGCNSSEFHSLLPDCW